MYVYLVIQTRNIPSTDYVVTICKTKELAEKWVIENCHQFGDCISTRTGKFMKPPSYNDYIEKKWFYYMYDKPALLIQPFNFIES